MPPHSPRIEFLPWKPEEAETLLVILSDPLTMRFWPQPFDLEGCKAWIARSLDQREKHGLGRLKLVLRQTGEIVGDAGIVRTLVNGREEHDLGYIIHASNWGQGFGLEAARAFLEHAFDALNLKRVVANMATDNLASRKVAERLGMTLECRFNNPRNRDIETFLFVAERG